MELQICYLFACVAIINHLLVCQAAGGDEFDPDNFDINTNTVTERGKCVRRITIKGNGVTDTLKTGCSENSVNILRQDDVMMYGQPPEDSFYLLSDALKTLYVIQDDQCTRRTYKGNRWVVKLSADACAELMERIHALADPSSDGPSSDSREGSDGEAESSGDAQGTSQADPTSFFINSNTLTINGKCMSILTVEGSLVSDVFKTECSNHGFNILRQSGVMVYGRPETDTFSLYIDAMDSVVVIENGKCTRKTYYKTGQSPTIASLLDVECTTLKKRATYLHDASNHVLALKLENAAQKLNEELQTMLNNLK